MNDDVLLKVLHS